MRPICYSILLLFAILFLAVYVEGQKLRRENDALKVANRVLDAEANHAWQMIRELRSTLAAMQDQVPDPTAGMQFIDR